MRAVQVVTGDTLLFLSLLKKKKERRRR